MSKLKLENLANPEWKDKPTITREILEEFQANSIAYAENNKGNYASSNVDAPVVVMLMSLVQEMRELKVLLSNIGFSEPSLVNDANKKQIGKVKGGRNQNKKGSTQDILKP